jgi:hypothetical protein
MFSIVNDDSILLRRKRKNKRIKVVDYSCAVKIRGAQRKKEAGDLIDMIVHGKV